jgi:NAD(P)-dependent dehydrogenase (short-subunit alcohol dehydrogenase family)
MSTTTDRLQTRRDPEGHDATRAVLEENSPRRLARKVAVITGGSTGMGLATAKRFVLEGMDHVFITGRRKDVLEKVVAEIGETATGVPGDVANMADLERLYEIVKRYGRKLDVIFANAGIALQGPFGNVDEKFLDLHFDAKAEANDSRPHLTCDNEFNLAIANAIAVRPTLVVRFLDFYAGNHI